MAVGLLPRTSSLTFLQQKLVTVECTWAAVTLHRRRCGRVAHVKRRAFTKRKLQALLFPCCHFKFMPPVLFAVPFPYHACHRPFAFLLFVHHLQEHHHRPM